MEIAQARQQISGENRAGGFFLELINGSLDLESIISN
jgi:hypothetical protein